MSRNVLRIPAVICIALMVAAATIIPSGLNSVSANGATRSVVKNARVGPYELQVGILPGNPKVGNLHLSILVKDAEVGAPITDAIIMVMATGPAGATDVSPVQATNTPQGPQFYDVDLPLDMEGSWTLTLETNSSLGKANLEFPLEVTKTRGFNPLFPIAGAVAFLALTVWAWNRIHSRRRRHRQGA